jgi:hypothetical protein
MLAAALTILVAAPAYGQAARGEGTGFLNVDVGFQPQQQRLTSSTSFPLYDETATVATSQPVPNGPIFGVSGGYRVRDAVGIGGGVTLFHARSAESSISATIPDLAFVRRSKLVTAVAGELTHREVGVHTQLLWFHELDDKVDLALAAGPSIIIVSHDSAFVSVPAGSQNAATATTRETKPAFGFNAGADLAFAFAPRAGVGLFVRYTYGSVDLLSGTELPLGGLQAGAGMRFRF